jgi:hypothetical protein
MPDAGKELDETLGLAGQSGCGAEGLGLAAQRGYCLWGRLSSRLPETSQIRDKGHLALNNNLNRHYPSKPEA